jgi:hypothetical protein
MPADRPVRFAWTWEQLQAFPVRGATLAELTAGLVETIRLGEWRSISGYPAMFREIEWRIAPWLHFRGGNF